MQRRAEQVAETRQRITEAAVLLHGTVGPAATSISAIAEQAGVTRLTVYRHFPGEVELFTACSQHWLAQQSPPRPDRWAQIVDPVERLLAGLTDLYRFYRAGESMLTLIHRDWDAIPQAVRQVDEERERHIVDILTQAFHAASAKDKRLLRALAAHAVSFPTWRSLCIGQGLSDTRAASAMTALVGSATSTAE